jgi:hypothetical protein
MKLKYKSKKETMVSNTIPPDLYYLYPSKKQKEVCHTVYWNVRLLNFEELFSSIQLNIYENTTS